MALRNLNAKAPKEAIRQTKEVQTNILDADDVIPLSLYLEEAGRLMGLSTPAKLECISGSVAPHKAGSANKMTQSDFENQRCHQARQYRAGIQNGYGYEMSHRSR